MREIGKMIKKNCPNSKLKNATIDVTFLFVFYGYERDDRQIRTYNQMPPKARLDINC